MYDYHGKVVDVYDGDTCTIVVDLGFRVQIEIKVRLLGINAPELKGVTKDAGFEARNYLIQLIAGKYVYIKTYKDKQEKYGRWLGEIYLSDNSETSVNHMMITAGHAVAYMD